MTHLVLEPTDRDPREDEDWFKRLPPDVQESTRQAWRRRFESQVVGRSPQVRKAMREGAVLMAGCLFLVNMWTAGSVLVLLGTALVGAAVGAGVGLVALTTCAGRFRCALLGAGGYLLAQSASGAVRLAFGQAGSILGAPVLVLLLFGTWLALNVFALWGVRREFRAVVGGEN